MSSSSPRFAFFGTPQVAVYVLEELHRAGFTPEVIITAPDAPAGRGMNLTAPPAKVWAETHTVPVLQPEKLDGTFLTQIRDIRCDLFIVAAYGKIIPENIFHLPRYETLNVHPSLLPRLRGASPIQSAILEEDETGVSIMLIDNEMDHGPVIAQRKIPLSPWPPKARDLEKTLATEGGKLLAEVIPEWTRGRVVRREQNHGSATYCKKFVPNDAFINLADDAQKNFRKIQAFDRSPRAHFFAERNGKKVRVIITDAALEDDKLILKRVLPEGKKEMSYEDFQRNR